MKISVVIPVCNEADNVGPLAREIQAALADHRPFEIIFVDDGSTDGTRDWLRTLPPSIRVVLNDRNLGYAAANNRGAALARGRYLALLNNDLVLTPHWLEPILAAFQRLGSRAGVIGNVQRDARTGAIDHTGIVINLKAKPEHDTWFPPRWIRALRPTRRVPAVTGACAFIARELWEKLGGFDEGFHNGGEDVDLCFRARAAGRINLVALRSIVLHHISASPGRALRNEQNSRRLALRWRAELEHAALRRWCRHYLDREWNSPHPSLAHADARAALFYALHLRRTPPPIAVAAMRAAMDHELARWDRLLR